MPTDFAAMIAIDWADQKHAWAMQAGTSKVETGAIDHTPEAIDVWAAELRMRFGGQSVAVALEQSRRPLVFMLNKYDHLVIFPVHPTILVNYRKSFRPSGAKDDPSDAKLLLDILMLHRDKLRRLNPDTPETRTLQFLVEERRKFVHEKTRCSNRLTAHLKMCFPQVLDWFDEIGSNIAAEFLERWPSLDKLQRARPATIERFFIDHNSRDPERIKERLEQIRKAVPATTDAAVVTSSTAAIVTWAGLLKQLLVAITAYDKQIDELARAHLDYALVKSFPGAGPAMAPRLIAALGSQRERYQSAAEIQQYSGIAPVVASSGSSTGSTGAGLARSSSGRHSTSGHSIRSHTRIGRANTTSSSARRASGGIRPSAPSPSNGFAFFFVAGRTAHRTTKRSIKAHWPHGGRINSPPRQLWNSSGKTSLASRKSR